MIRNIIALSLVFTLCGKSYGADDQKMATEPSEQPDLPFVVQTVDKKHSKSKKPPRLTGTKFFFNKKTGEKVDYNPGVPQSGSKRKK